jgi:predicted HTH domain antitoxin
MSKHIILEFPAEVPERGLQDEDALKKGKAIIVLESLRKGKISQGKAAELLEMDRNGIFDLMTAYDIPMADFPKEEFLRQVEEVAKPSIKRLSFLRQYTRRL